MALQITGTYNFRDVAENVPAIRKGVLFRSDSLDAIDDQTAERLHDSGVMTIIDLRDEQERGGRTSKLQTTGADVIQIPMLAGSIESILTEGMTLEKIYADMADHSGVKIAEAIQAVAESPQSVIVHCTAGKDRTGVVVALVLVAIGVARDEILADYALSENNLRGEWANKIDERLAAHGITATDSLRAMAYSSQPSTMRALFAHLTATYGSVEEYLLSIGIDANIQQALKAKLLP